MSRHAVLFGLNYEETPEARLRGCVNDVLNMKDVLQSPEYHFDDVRALTTGTTTTARNILTEMDNLASRSHVHNLEVAWIHFSGHGCSVTDLTGDERDGKDECIVPSDFRRVGVVSDDLIRTILRKFNPKTKVVCIFDCCHSGTIGDLKYRYISSNTVHTEHTGAPCPAKVMMLSGCSDTQTSADAYNVNNAYKFSGAMTSCLITSMKEMGEPDKIKIHELIVKLRDILKEKQFTQVPQLCASYFVRNDETLF